MAKGSWERWFICSPMAVVADRQSQQLTLSTPESHHPPLPLFRSKALSMFPTTTHCLSRSGYLALVGQFANRFMKILFTLLALCFALNAHAATYMLLSQTNAFAAGITNEAKAYADTKAPIDSPAITGTPTINGQSIETQLTNKVDKTLTTDQSMSGRLLTPSLTIGALAVSRGTLTHADGNVIIDFSLTNRIYSCTITGNVTFVQTNAAAGKWFNIDLYMPATNCLATYNMPTGSSTNFYGGIVTNYTANTVGSLSFYAKSSDTNATKIAYQETQ